MPLSKRTRHGQRIARNRGAGARPDVAGTCRRGGALSATAIDAFRRRQHDRSPDAHARLPTLTDVGASVPIIGDRASTLSVSPPAMRLANHLAADPLFGMPLPMPRHHTKTDALRTLKQKGLEVATILDVGVQFDTPDLRRAFPHAHHVLFEPIAEYHDAIKKNYSGLSHEIVEAAVADADGEMQLHSIRDDESTGLVSHVTSARGEWQATRTVRKVALDSFLLKRDFPKPFLLKIDVDGGETAVMEGAYSTLRASSCLIFETTLPHVPDRCMLAKASSMCLWDIVDLAYYEDSLYQVDLIFLPYPVIQENIRLDPYTAISRKLDPARWYEHPG